MLKDPLASGTFACVLPVQNTGDRKTVLRIAVASGAFAELMRAECEILRDIGGADGIVSQIEAMLIGYSGKPVCTVVQHLVYAGTPVARIPRDEICVHATSIRRQMHSILAFLASRDIVHSDIMPNNVVADGPRITLIDFNSARKTGTLRAANAATCREYRPPEGHFVHVAQPSYDIYSAAVLLCELETGVSLLRCPQLLRDPRATPDEMALAMTCIVDSGRATLGEPWASMLSVDPASRSTDGLLV